MRKKFTAILGAVLALTIPFTMTACGKNNNGGDEWWKTTGELQKNGGEIVYNDVGIRLSSIVTGADLTTLNQLIAQFNAEYSGKIRVSLNTVGSGSFEDYIASSITQGSKTAPDIVMAHQNSLKSFVDYKLVQPIDEAMEKTGVEFDLNAFSTGINQYSNAGTDYNFGVPVDAASMVIYYNKDLLKQYTDTVPSTREELFAVCEAYKQDTGAYPVTWETGCEFFYEFIMPTAVLQNGGTLYKDDMHVDWYDNAEQREIYKKAVQSVRSFITSGYAVVGTSEKNGLKDFRENKTLFYMSMPWYLDDVCKGYAATNNITEEVAKTEKVGATSIAKWFAMDASKDYASKIYGDSHTFSITKKVEDITQKAACLEFIRWFTSKSDVGTEWAGAGHISISNAINSQDDYKNDYAVANFINKWYPDINDLNTMGNTPYYSELAKSLRSILSEGLLKSDNTGDEELIRSKQNEFNSNIDLWGGQL